MDSPRRVEVTLAAELRDPVTAAVRLVAGYARGSYHVSTTAISTGAVDFHPHAATSAALALASAEIVDGAATVSMSLAEAEAVSKILMNSFRQRAGGLVWRRDRAGCWVWTLGGQPDPEWRALSLAARKVFEAAVALLVTPVKA